MRIANRLGVVALFALGTACGGGGGGPDVSIAKAGAPNGDNQTAPVSSVLPESLAVMVQEDGVPKAGVMVTWMAQGVGGLASPTTALTDANGRAAARWTLGSVLGAQTARATLFGATGSPVTFNAFGDPPAGSTLTRVGGDITQTVYLDLDYGVAMLVFLSEPDGDALPGLTVNWAVLSGSVSLVGGNSSVTDGGGIVTKGITGGISAGPAVVRATSPAAPGSQVDFNLTVKVAPVVVNLGDNFFKSQRNNSSNPAVDTTTVGRDVLWINLFSSHSIESIGSPSFPSSATIDGSGPSTYAVTFDTPGTYQYDCSIHTSAMTGRIVVLP